MNFAIVLGLSIPALLILGGVLGLRNWARKTSSKIELLYKLAQQPGVSAPVLPVADEEQLPACLQRYFNFALPAGSSSLPTKASLTQSGSMQLGADPHKWSPFVAQQHVTATRPGFVWAAEFRFGPVPLVMVNDSYLDGLGAMQASLLGLKSIVNSEGSKEIAAASLQRWLAEAAWLPTCLLPREAAEGQAALTWRELGPHSALASLHDAALQIELEFRFGAGGEITSIYSPARFRDVAGKQLPTAWEGRFTDYAECDGLMPPMGAEVGWHIDGSYQPYWRGRIESAEFS